MSAFSTEDQQWMRQALELAFSGQGWVEPNPMVGCVLVSKGCLIGAGYHARFGGPHAERAAIADAIANGNASELAGCTAFVTLEPCCHQGKTPACTDALIEARISRVVACMHDPFSKVSGAGFEILREHGIGVEVGLEQDQAEFINAPYLKRLRKLRPWVIAKWAMSLDGKIATRTGHSQWISGESSRRKVQELRGRVDAILVGSGTVLCDDPRLTARTEQPPPRCALRVVADSRLRIPLDSQLAQTCTQVPVLVCTGPLADTSKLAQLREIGVEVYVSRTTDPQQRLDDWLKYLAQEKNVTNLLVEGGGELLGSMFQLAQVDQCEVFIAPMIIGGSQAASPVAGLGFGRLEDGPKFCSADVQPSGVDTLIRCRVVHVEP